MSYRKITTRGKITRACNGCGENYDVYPSRIRTGFCSRECKKRHSSKLVTCTNCGNAFRATPSNKRVFCNMKCRTEYSRKSNGGPDGSLRFMHKELGYFVLQWPGGASELEHRYVWAQANGPIPEGHVIHHVNENRKDNRIQNLRCMLRGDHVRLHLSGSKRHGVLTQLGIRAAREQKEMEASV